MLKRITFLSALIAVAALIGCNGGGASIYYVQGFNVLSDGPPLSFRQNGLTIANGVPYGTSSGFLPGTVTGRKNIEIQPVLADLSLGPVFLQADVDVNRDIETTLVVAGFYDAPELIVVNTGRRRRPIGEIYFQFIHTASAFDTLDVYVAAPDTDLSTTAPLSTIAQYQFSTSMEIPFGEYVISVTPAGSPDQILYRSSKLTFVDVPESNEEGVEWLIAVSDNVLIGSSPLRLLVSSENGSFPLSDEDTNSAVRVTNASPDAPPVDSFVDDDFATALTTNTGYTERSPLSPIAVGDVKLSFTETGTVTPILYEFEREYLDSVVQDVYLVRNLAELTALTVGGIPRSVATEGKLRFGNVSPAAAFLSVYLADSGSSELDQADLIVRDIPFPASTDYLRIVPGEYSLIVTERTNNNDETIIIGPLPFEVVGGEVETLLVMVPESGGEDEVLVVYDDLLP
jgi:hypothetical protein